MNLSKEIVIWYFICFLKNLQWYYEISIDCVGKWEKMCRRLLVVVIFLTTGTTTNYSNQPLNTGPVW